MMIPTCKTCIWFSPGEAGAGSKFICRRFPPVEHMVMVNGPPSIAHLKGEPQAVFISRFPQTAPDNWCGEHECIDEEAAANT